MMKTLPRTIVLSLILVLPLLAAACTGAPQRAYPLAPVDSLPAEVQAAPAKVRKAYQFAIANPDIIRQFPCYCGCVGLGHTSNYACYVAGEADDGTLIFEPHALGCSICVDITQDVRQMLDQGKSIPEIQASVDQTYSRFGPPTIGQ